MGNPRKDRPTNRKNQPSKIQLSTATISSQQDVSHTENGLSITLEHVDSQVIIFTNVGSVVTLHRVGDFYEAHFNKQRLGNVPARFTAIISARQITTAAIEEVRHTPIPQVVIKVSLWHSN